MKWLVQVISSLAVVTAVAGELPSEARQAELRYLLTQDCGSCHGLTLKGGLGPALTREALAGKPAAFLSWTIMNGRPGTAMPPWRGFVNDAEGEWLAQILLNGEVTQ